jgi:hypothetical protein
MMEGRVAIARPPDSSRKGAFLICLVLGFSAVIVARDLDWCIEDNPSFTHSIHSDEQRKVESVRRMKLTWEGMRPDRFLLAKGTLLSTLGRFLYEAVDRTPARDAFALLFGVRHDSAAGTYLLLRSISALCFLAATYLVFRVTLLLSGQVYPGVIAAVLFATAFGAAFSAVIFKSDMLLTALVAGLFLAAARYGTRPTAGRAAAMGLLVGLAISAKYLGALAGVLPAVAWVVVPGRRARLGHVALAGTSVVVGLFFSAPFLFFDYTELVAALQYQAQMQTTRSYHFEEFGFQPWAVLAHLLVAGLGVVFTVFALAGIGYAAWRCFGKQERHLYLAPLCYVALQFAVLSVSSWLVVRYTLPLYPVLASLAGIAAWRLGRFLAARPGRASRAALALLVLLGVGHTLRFLAFDRLLRDPVPTVRAAAWLRNEVEVEPSARVLEIRRRPPLVYGFGARQERLTESDVQSMVAKGQRLSGLGVDYVVVTERSFRQFFRLRSAEYASHRFFFSELFDNRRFALVARFDTPASVFGLEFPKGFLPQDLVLIAPDTYVFESLSHRSRSASPPLAPGAEDLVSLRR